MTLVTKLSARAIKSTDDTDGHTVAGYASTFNSVDHYGDTIAPGAFTNTIQKHQAEGTRLPVLFQHDSTLGSHVGYIDNATEDEHGLYVTIQLDDDETGTKAFNLCKSRRINAMSIGFRSIAEEPNPDGAGYLITEADLVEVSLVMSPANPEALITDVKSYSDDRASERLTGLLKSIQSTDGPQALATALDTMRVKSETTAAADDYFTALTGGTLTGPSTRNHKIGYHLDAATIAATEKKAALHIITKARDEHRDLTAADRALLDLPRSNAKARDDIRKHEAITRQLKSMTLGADAPNPNQSKEDTPMTDNLPLTAKARTEVARRAVDEIHTKGITSGAGSLTVSTAVGDITGIEHAGTTILDIIPATRLTTPEFSYLKQTARDLKAARVATGAEKPKSDLKFTRVDSTLEVVAHIVRGIDEYILSDVTGLNSFISSEMIVGVHEAVEAWAVEEIASASGKLAQAYTTDAFTTARMGINQLQATGLTPVAVVLSPSDWARMETTKAAGAGTFLFNSAPVDQTNGTLWGVPVVTSHRLADGAGYVIADGAVELFHDGQVKVAFNSSGDEFERNELSFRTEGRFCPVVKREAGVVSLALTDSTEG